VVLVEITPVFAKTARAIPWQSIQGVQKSLARYPGKASRARKNRSRDTLAKHPGLAKIARAIPWQSIQGSQKSLATKGSAERGENS